MLVTNLKPANMRGIKSQAMVLAASSPDGSKVELVTPPEVSRRPMEHVAPHPVRIVWTCSFGQGRRPQDRPLPSGGDMGQNRCKGLIDCTESINGTPRSSLYAGEVTGDFVALKI